MQNTTGKEQEVEKAKVLENFAVKFFQYWYNQKGNNTKEGYYDWTDTLDGSCCIKDIANAFESPPTTTVLDSEELWDEFAELIDSDIDSLQYYAGRNIITQESFKKLMAKICK